MKTRLALTANFLLDFSGLLVFSALLAFSGLVVFLGFVIFSPSTLFAGEEGIFAEEETLFTKESVLDDERFLKGEDFFSEEDGSIDPSLRRSLTHPRVHSMPDDYLFVFAVIADTHIRVRYPMDDRRYLKAMTIAPQLLSTCVSDINRHRPRVDFVIHLGDVTDLGDSAEFAIAQELMDQLNMDWYAVVGNHDNFKSDGKRGWKNFARMDSTQYSFDYGNLHFVIIDCTLDPYVAPYVNCDSIVREWVRADLLRNRNKPTIVLSHFNMWERGWNAMFDTTSRYEEHLGIPELRQIFEESGNVVAVINGHVHANRVKVHNGIYYIDINALVVGKPSIRYFYVCKDRIVVTYEYLSDPNLLAHLADLCTKCTNCFDREKVCNFIDGRRRDKFFIIPLPVSPEVIASSPDPSFEIKIVGSTLSDVEILVSSSNIGKMYLSLYDVLGRSIEHLVLSRAEGLQRFRVGDFLNSNRLSSGVYFLGIRTEDRLITHKVLVLK